MMFESGREDQEISLKRGTSVVSKKQYIRFGQNEEEGLIRPKTGVNFSTKI